MIVCKPLERDFTVINNALLRDERLSIEATAVMTWLLSKPRDWVVQVDQLRKRFRTGRERMQRVMRELVACGWVVRRPARAAHGSTFAGSEYVVFNVQQPVQAPLAFDGAADPTPTERPADRLAEPDRLAFRETGFRAAVRESVCRETGIPTPYQERTLPRTDSPPSVSNETEPPKGGRSRRSSLCPSGFEPGEAHYQAAAAEGFDRRFVLGIRDRMHEWSHANAHRPIARKADWSLTLTGFLRRAIAETKAKASRPAAPRRESSHGALALLVDMYGDPHEPSGTLDKLGLGLDRGPVIDHGAYGDAHGDVRQPFGGSPRGPWPPAYSGLPGPQPRAAGAA